MRSNARFHRDAPTNYVELYQNEIQPLNGRERFVRNSVTARTVKGRSAGGS